MHQPMDCSLAFRSEAWNVPITVDKTKEAALVGPIRAGDCVKIPDGRVARVREAIDGKYKVRVRRKTSKSHQFLVLDATDVDPIECPKGWMSPEGYNRYLAETLAKMRERLASKDRKEAARETKPQP